MVVSVLVELCDVGGKRYGGWDSNVECCSSGGGWVEGYPHQVYHFKKSSKGLESQRVTGPGGIHCVGSERRPKGKKVQKRRSKGDRCYNCGGLDHHAKECKLPPQPKKCHFCQSIDHMVANCPIKAQQSSPGSQGKPSSVRGDEEEHTDTKTSD